MKLKDIGKALSLKQRVDCQEQLLRQLYATAEILTSTPGEVPYDDPAKFVNWNGYSMRMTPEIRNNMINAVLDDISALNKQLIELGVDITPEK